MSSGVHRINTYVPASERAYHVGILFAPGHAAWVVHDVNSGSPVAMAWGTDEGVLRHADLPRDPRAVSYVALPEWSTMIPTGALDPAHAEAHLALVHGALRGSPLRHEHVAVLGAECLYRSEDAHTARVLERFPNARSIPLQSMLARIACDRSVGRDHMLLHRDVGRVDIAVAKDRRLSLSSSFPARTAEDVLYFALLAAERTGCDPRTMHVDSGGSESTADERALLDRYFMHHGTASRWPGVTLPGQERVERFFAAFEQFACVS